MINLAVRFLILFGAFSFLVHAQYLRSDREASLIDEMLCHGDYVEALKLTERDLLIPEADTGPLTPYVGALFIEVGKLEMADRVLNLQPDKAYATGSNRAALARERAALLLAKGEYKLSAAEAIEAYKFSVSDRTYKSRRAYAASIAAESLLRSGDLNEAREYASRSLKSVENQKRSASFFIPRVFYTACLVASYSSSPQTAEPLCLRGLALTKRSRKPTRDLSLGYLALAEARLKNGNFRGSKDAAIQCLTLAKTLFGPVHQDAVNALELMSIADARGGRRADAQNEAGRSLALARRLFGPNSRRVAELTEALQSESLTAH